MKLKYLSKERLKHSVWSAEDEKKLLEMAKKKTPIAKVYEEFNPRSVSAIKNKIVRMYLSRKDDILQVLP